MVPTCIDPDRAAATVNRKTLTGYVKLPNYQNYLIEAGFEEEMQAIRKAIVAGQEDKLPSLMSDRWLSQVTLYGSPQDVRDGVEGWYAGTTLRAKATSARRHGSFDGHDLGTVGRTGVESPSVSS